MVIDAVNSGRGGRAVAISSEGMEDCDGYYLATVEVHHVATSDGFGYFAHLHDVGYRDISFSQATAIAARLHTAWLRAVSS
jgi:hypothetical protein